MIEQIALSFGIPLAYIAIGIAALGAVAFPLVQMFQDLKKAVTTLIGVGILTVVFFLCYALAASEPFTIGEIHVAGGQMKFIEAGIILFYVLLSTSVLAILYSSVSSYFK